MPDDCTPIAQLRNLGVACERDLNAVQIYTLGDIKELGIEKTFEVLMLGRIARGARHRNGGGTTFNAVYLYALYGAVHDIDWRAIPDVKKSRFKELTARMRKEHGS
ncbi:TfoX/Sxy family protein [Rubripirellula amarantea]|uniref:TfoX C-terminal domain-containing protein n=1 Tax=Rubripirellula amarantea TaxID=2527999 RepID=A0A5C5WNJ3_9BACT|nr:TfoX/Sxy family DNA transformation protein [Rubripirellula amarantea]MDA8743657.1 TfoX/Sxy family protein [Rubripirellula amarantea]TWT52394.1 hypothetical protein Pla22_00180 [Rubripirellula amarantea]